jgi:pantoate--beta-alanine ligase
MKIASTIAEARSALAEAARPIGLVPTMGYLHDGHLSLVRRAGAECRTVVVSIFVNPTQFGPGEDFERYPRDVPRDLRLCEENAVDLVFTPNVSEMYAPQSSTFVEVEKLQDRWEGASRPGHFRGVATVVAKLFRVVGPQYAYFGEKDYQQLQIVRRMSLDLSLDVQVVGCPIIREPDGLAMSSRNVYLQGDNRTRAVALYQALLAAQRAASTGETSGHRLNGIMEETLRSTPGIDPDYAAIVDPLTLDPLDRLESEARAIIAARLGPVRLIDNMALALAR